MKSVLTNLGRAAGIPEDLCIGLYLLTCFFYPIPFYALIPKHAQNVRHLFSIAASSVLFLTLFSVFDLLELFGMCLIVYLSTYIFRTKKWMPVFVFVYILGGVTEKPMMMMVIRLTTFAWYVHDGTLDKKLQPLSIKEFPNILEYFGYTCFFASYRSFIRREAPFDKIPSRVRPVLTTFTVGFLSAVTHVVLTQSYSYEYVATTEFYETLPLWKRLLYIQVSGISARTKYYAIFQLTQSASNLIGIGYTGPSPTNSDVAIWRRAQNVSILDVEFAQNFKQLFGAWNMKTALWLRNCVYLRMVPFGKKPGPVVTFCTFMVSALWHGFYPGYYFTFALGALFPILARSMRKYLRPLFVDPGSKIKQYKWVYDFLGWFFCWTSLNCIVAPFIAYHHVGYYAIIWLAIGFVVVDFMGMGKWVRIHGGKWVGIDPPQRQKTHTKKEE
ncbi:MBOAT, membrane-bound O-acyltransferase family-domain-containing protein [Chytriomyces cf. hyalinus JEL632]|nr:MBOAT, membrane-bound O-acyltransferase family-domain-containing protein [Chytriomyces cf. hyalinus JEL632]